MTRQRLDPPPGRAGVFHDRYEVHFTDPDQFLEELALDHKQEAVLHGLVRFSVNEAPARLKEIYPNAPENMETLMRSRWLDVSYISTREQLIQLSCYLGWFDPKEAEKRKQHNEDQRKVELETVGLLKNAVQKLELEVRGGGMFTNDGQTWQANPEAKIDRASPVVEPVCATCGEDIYFANESWRHKETHRAEEWEERTCTRCGGSGFQERSPALGVFGDTRCICWAGGHPGIERRLDHLADPSVKNRLV